MSCEAQLCELEQEYKDFLANFQTAWETPINIPKKELLENLSMIFEDFTDEIILLIGWEFSHTKSQIRWVTDFRVRFLSALKAKHEKEEKKHKIPKKVKLMFNGVIDCGNRPRVTYGVFPQELIPTFGTSKQSAIRSRDVVLEWDDPPYSSISNAYHSGEACVFGSRVDPDDPESELFNDEIFTFLLSACAKRKWSYECWHFKYVEERCATHWGYAKQKSADEEYVMVQIPEIKQCYVRLTQETYIIGI